jgi:tetratricopeptide (TPR) repeat protein
MSFAEERYLSDLRQPQFYLGLSLEPHRTRACTESAASPDNWIAACSTIVAAGRVSGQELAAAYAQRGFAFTLKRKLDEAEKDLNDAIKVDPGSAKNFAMRANFWNVSGKPDRALTDSNDALRIDSNFALAYFTRASAALQLGQYDRAIADYSKALRLRPSFGVDIYKMRGRAYYRKGDYNRAIADYDERLKLQPDDVGQLLNRGDALRNKKDYPRRHGRLWRSDAARLRIRADGTAAADLCALSRKISKARSPT